MSEKLTWKELGQRARKCYKETLELTKQSEELEKARKSCNESHKEFLKMFAKFEEVIGDQKQ